METRYEEANKITIQSILWNVVLTIIKVIAGVIGNSTFQSIDCIVILFASSYLVSIFIPP